MSGSALTSGFLQHSCGWGVVTGSDGPEQQRQDHSTEREGRQHQALIRRHPHQIPSCHDALIIFRDAGRAASAVPRMIRPTSDTPMSSSTIKTPVDTLPQRLSSKLIRSATGTPLRNLHLHKRMGHARWPSRSLSRR